jgi:Amt family ammonium transporter
VAGLATVTQAAGFVQPISAVLIGLIAGAGCFFMVVKVKGWCGYDDSLDAFGVHGVGGTMGALLTGIFASSAINPIFGKDALGHARPTGWVDGNPAQVLHQMTAAGIAWGIAIVGTLAILFVVDHVVGLRVSEDEEEQGLDLTQHGEQGYDWEGTTA